MQEGRRGRGGHPLKAFSLGEGRGKGSVSKERGKQKAR